MDRFIIIKLKGPMQAWGQHTFEGIRPSSNIPTKSAIIGMIGACLGIRRNDPSGIKQLVDGLHLAVRADAGTYRLEKITDYHTILDARMEYSGLKSHKNSIQTWREYLCDAEFTAAIWLTETSAISLDQITDALKNPFFTPFLGRRGCPITRPLLDQVMEADDFMDALAKVPPMEGVVYSDTDLGTGRAETHRDVPIPDQPRQFANRTVYSYAGGNHASE